MNWHLTAVGNNADELVAHLQTKIDEYETTNKAPLKHARRAVRELVNSDAYGEGPYSAVLSGFVANGDKSPGNSVAITVYSKK